MLILYLLCYAEVLIKYTYVLCSKTRIVLCFYVQISTSKSLYTYSRQFRKTVLIEYIYKWQQKYTACSLRQLEYSIYQSHLLQFINIMLALCLMFSMTYSVCSNLCWHNRLVPIQFIATVAS